jgi:hypothetical protein
MTPYAARNEAYVSEVHTPVSEVTYASM